MSGALPYLPTYPNCPRCITSGQFKIHFINMGSLFSASNSNQHKQSSVRDNFIEELEDPRYLDITSDLDEMLLQIDRNE